MARSNQQPDDAELEEDPAPVADPYELGYIGTKVDPLPNEAYTVAGLTAAARAELADELPPPSAD